MLIFDGDYPMAHGGLDLRRDLTLSVMEARATESEHNNIVYCTLPEMRKSGIATALVKICARIQRTDDPPLWGYRDANAAYGVAQGQLAYYRMLAQNGESTLITSRHGMMEHIEKWENADDPTGLPVGFVLGMEGADPILWPDQLENWWADGIRVVSLTHYGISAYAHGTGTVGGLKGDAVSLLRKMEELKVILDTTHLDDQSFWQAIERFHGAIIASHQNCRALVPGQRQFTDKQIHSIIERDGIVGVSMDTWMLYNGYQLDWAKTATVSRREIFPRDAVTLEHVADHIDHICQLAGNANHAAIVGDTDGEGGLEGLPYGVDTVADYQKLAPILSDREYSSEDIDCIMHRNWQHFYETHLPE